MENNELSEAQQLDYQERMTRGVAFEEIANSKGFEYIKAYYQNSLANFVNDVFNSESTPLEKFEDKRHEILGLKKLIAKINGDMDFLKNERSKEETK